MGFQGMSGPQGATGPPGEKVNKKLENKLLVGIFHHTVEMA